MMGLPISRQEECPSERGSQDGRMRLQKFLARAGVASRRRCEQFISDGRICVNGKVVREMGTTVDPTVDVIEFDGALCRLPEANVVIMLNKPAGFLTAMQDSRKRTVADLVPTDEYPGLFPIGRLDYDTTGLLLFTTDGELGNALLHPSHHVEKRYLALVDGVPSESDLSALEGGIMLEDGMTAPAKCSIVEVKPDKSESKLAISIHEGRKRQVKRMCAAVGHNVISLHREAFGSLVLGSLAEGHWRKLTDAEVGVLRRISNLE